MRRQPLPVLGRAVAHVAAEVVPRVERRVCVAQGLHVGVVGDLGDDGGAGDGKVGGVALDDAERGDTDARLRGEDVTVDEEAVDAGGWWRRLGGGGSDRVGCRCRLCRHHRLRPPYRVAHRVLGRAQDVVRVDVGLVLVHDAHGVRVLVHPRRRPLALGLAHRLAVANDNALGERRWWRNRVGGLGAGRGWCEHDGAGVDAAEQAAARDLVDAALELVRAAGEVERGGGHLVCVGWMVGWSVVA